MSRFTTRVHLFAVATLLVSCAAATADQPPTKPQHEPFVNTATHDGLLCEQSMRGAKNRLAAAAAGVHIDEPKQVAVDAYSRELWSGSPFRADRAAVLNVSLPNARPEHRLRIDLAPQRDGDCIAIRISEECGPSLAPEGEPRAWHPCGDPGSGAFFNAKNQLLEKLGLSAVEND